MKSNRIAAALLQRGLKGGDCMVVECTQDTRFLLLNMGAELAGMVFVPFERRAAQARVDDICGEVQPALAVIDSGYTAEAAAAWEESRQRSAVILVMIATATHFTTGLIISSLTPKMR